jgi:peptide-methionine (R)-S-oxide reductase
VPKQFTDVELKKKLMPEQYHILREKGTEAPFSGKYLNHSEQGMYTCAVCGAELFSSDTKYDSTTPGLIGWPSFYDIAKSGAVKLIDDDSLGMHRIEATCTNCGSHLGHMFEDDSAPNGKHFCINSVSLEFLSDNKKSKND